MRIPKRLLSVAEQVMAGAPMADIGSDHALLPCYLVSEGVCPRAICGELGDGPFQRALRAVEENKLARLIEVRQGDGLEALAAGEAATVVLAGLGGHSIIEILQRSPGKTESFERLVLQPMNALPEVRRLAASRGWRLERETVVKDGGYYVNLVLAPRPGEPYCLSETELRWGPLLMRQAGETVVRDYFTYHLRKLTRITAGIPLHGADRSRLQKKAYQQRIEELEEVLR